MNARGFTLAEVLVALFTVALLLAGLFVVQQQGQSAYLTGAARVETQQNARLALDRIAHELRLAKAVIAAPGCGTLATGGSDITFTFVDDAGADVTVRYYLSASNVLRNQTAPAPATAQPETLTGGVEELRMWCYRADGVLTATPGDTRAVRMSLKTREERAVATAQPGHQQAVVESRVRMRNLL